MGVSFGVKINIKLFQKLDQKWTPKKIAVKSHKNAPDGSEPDRRATDAGSTRLLLKLSAARGGKEGKPSKERVVDTTYLRYLSTP